jgi:hypothetical protein
MKRLRLICLEDGDETIYWSKEGITRQGSLF